MGTLLQLIQAPPGASGLLSTIDLDRPDARVTEVVHEVDLEPSSTVASWTGSTRIGVNSLHHQAVATAGSETKIGAYATDGTIEAVDDIAGSDRLVLLRVNFGGFTRQIVSGMKQERANPAEIVGRQALFVVNLEPRKMASEISEGMLFDIGYADGLTPVLSVPERPVPNGTRAG